MNKKKYLIMYYYLNSSLNLKESEKYVNIGTCANK